MTVIEKIKVRRQTHRESCHGNVLKMAKQQLITTSTHRYDACIMAEVTGHLLEKPQLVITCRYFWSAVCRETGPVFFFFFPYMFGT